MPTMFKFFSRLLEGDCLSAVRARRFLLLSASKSPSWFTFNWEGSFSCHWLMFLLLFCWLGCCRDAPMATPSHFPLPMAVVDGRLLRPHVPSTTPNDINDNNKAGCDRFSNHEILCQSQIFNNPCEVAGRIHDAAAFKKCLSIGMYTRWVLVFLVLSPSF